MKTESAIIAVVAIIALVLGVFAIYQTMTFTQQLDTANNKIMTLQNNYYDLLTNYSALQSTVNILNSQSSIQNGTISSLNSQISQLNATITSLETRISYSVPVTIFAYDPNDTYPRTWDVVFDRTMPPLANGGDHVGSDVDQAHYSGDSMTFTWDLVGGAHYLVFDVTQTGGSSYGTYSGIIIINGTSYNFSGLDGNNTLTINFTVPLT
jgi:uncharacterized protein YoxC